MAPNARTRFSNDLRYRDATHPNQAQLTPAYVLEPVRRDLRGIELDPCTETDNPTGAERFFTVDDDGLNREWDARSIFVNPPYGKAREAWVHRCVAAGATGAAVVLLMPAHTDTRIFGTVARTADALVFVRGRLKFEMLRPNRRRVAASHPSMLAGWNTDLEGCASLGERMFQ